MTPAPALEVEGLCVTYPDGSRVLDAVDLVVPAGDSVGLVGGSGSGKTTLIRAVLGILPPGSRVEGAVRVGGLVLPAGTGRDARRERAERLGYVAQDPYAACDPLRRVAHHVSEPWRALGQRPTRGAVVDRLAAVGIPDAATRSRQYPHQWSGGMLQRATTVAATAHHPDLTLADEPTSALDREVADESLRLLREHCRALLLVSHDLDLVARHSRSVVVLDQGRVVEHGDSGRVLRAPRHPTSVHLVRASRPAVLRRPEVTAAPRVVLDDIAVTYRVGSVTRAVVDGADLQVRCGEVVGVVGPSGSGKSTLLRLASGQERPERGTVLLDGRPAWPVKDRGRRTRADLPRAGWAMPVFQDPVASLDPRWPLWRSVTEPLAVSGVRLDVVERRRRARRALDEVGLDSVDLDRRPGSLSVGQCQRVAVARALLPVPGLVVADEPTASLDVSSAARVAALLRDAADTSGAAVLVVSHDEARLASYADRVVRMRRGRLTGGGPTNGEGTT